MHADSMKVEAMVAQDPGTQGPKDDINVKSFTNVYLLFTSRYFESTHLKNPVTSACDLLVYLFTGASSYHHLQLQDF